MPVKSYSTKRINLGELLIRNGLVTKEQIDKAKDIQLSNNCKLGEVLVTNKVITSEQLNKMLEFQLGIPYVDLEEYDINIDATKKVSESIAKKYCLIPININQNDLLILMKDPIDMYAIDDVRLCSKMNVIPMLGDNEKIDKAINYFYGKQEVLEAVNQFRIEKVNESKKQYQIYRENEVDELLNNSPIVKIVNSIIEQGIRSGSSDIHIEPYDKIIRIRYRLDGKLKEIAKYEAILLVPIILRIKIMCNLDITEKKIPQDGVMDVKVDGEEYEIRVSVLPTIYGEKIAMRVKNKLTINIEENNLGLTDNGKIKFSRLLKNSCGMILVTGPTGSGKTTTLYAALDQLNKEETNIITVEDPVETKVQGINQVQVNAKSGLTFQSMLKYLIRQDPDIIMVGEIRDEETAEIAIKASITGHLVLSTLHTNDAPSSITRLLDMGIKRYLIGTALSGVVAQRLVRKLCPKCKEKYIATSIDKKQIYLEEEEVILYRCKGCSYCNYTGYSGRIGIFEIMIMTDGLKELINIGASYGEIKKRAAEDGMISLEKGAINLVEKGVTSISEVFTLLDIE